MAEEKDSSQTATTTLLTLALFIILLSFFIVLNSLSSFQEQKAASVLESVELAFTSRIFKEDIAPSTRPDPLRLTGEGYNLTQLEGLFKTSFPAIDKTRYNPERGLFYVEVPFSDLDASIQSAENNSRPSESNISPLLDRLLAMSQDKQLNARLDIFILNSDDVYTSTRSLQEQRERLSSIAAYLENRGIPAQNLSIGFDKGRDDYARIRIRSAVFENPIGLPQKIDTTGETR